MSRCSKARFSKARYSRLAIVAVVLLAGACAQDSEDAGTTTTAPPADVAGASTTTVPADSTTTTAEVSACVTDLQVVNTAAAELDGLDDRDVEVVSLLADEGPHPANTVDYDSTLEVAFSEVELLEDPQFGLGIPIGAPENLGADDLYVSLSFFNRDEGIAVGQTFIDQLSYDETLHDGELNSVLAYYGSDERLLLGDTTVTITEITEEMVCGEISSITRTDLQTFIGFEGTFAADRIQALEG